MGAGIRILSGVVGALCLAQNALAAPTARIIHADAVQAGTPAQIVFSLEKSDGTPLTQKDLRVVHTKKLHALIIDPSLSDYHHEHPRATVNPGEYRVTFTPKTDHAYRVWVDATPVVGGHAYIPLDISGSNPAPAPEMDKTVDVGPKTVAGYNFALTLDAPPTVGKAVMAHIHVTKNGADFAKLEPVMGAFAHMVGFYDDGAHIAHLHPMGAEPKTTKERGGPDLDFHFEPEQAGFVKFFVQVRVGGKDIFVPFGINVK